MDIVIGVLLAMHNKKLALARGRRPGLFIFLTLILWFGLEITGAIIGVSLFGWSIDELSSMLYLLLLSYGMAGLGGLAAYLAAKSCKPGDYYPSQPMGAYASMPPYGAQPWGAPPFGAQPDQAPADPLDEPATLEIVRDASLRGDITSWTFALNGETVGSLGNGASRRTGTKQRQNTLTAVSDDGTQCMPLRFNVESGGQAEIHFKVDRFVPEASTGITPPAPPAQAQPAAPPAGIRFVPLARPALIDILRDGEGEGRDLSWTFSLNGFTLGPIADGQLLSAQTAQQQNALRAVDGSGHEAPPLYFSVQAGTRVLVRFGADHFMTEKCAGLLPLDAAAPPMPPYGQPPYGAPNVLPYGQPPYGTPNVPPYGQPPYGAPNVPPYGQPPYGTPNVPPYGQPPEQTGEGKGPEDTSDKQDKEE
jgi:hypothetical protein